MTLTTKDKSILSKLGVSSTDFAQIELAASKTTFEHYPKIGAGRKITQKDAIRLLGRESFLAGLSRSAFHWSAMQDTEDGGAVYFDSSKFFE